ncbi:MAG: DUF481 domain-containing protein [Puniceicoccaceae bacterium]
MAFRPTVFVLVVSHFGAVLAWGDSARRTADDVWLFDSNGASTFDSGKIQVEGSTGSSEPTASLPKVSFRGQTYKLHGADDEVKDFQLGLRFEVPVSELTFVQTQTLVDSTFNDSISFGYRQSLGYGLLLWNTDRFRFSLAPGVAGGYENDSTLSFEDRLSMLGNFNQRLSLSFSEKLVVNQEFNYFVQRVDDDNLATFMNVDLETLLSNRLSFKVSYEVKYDDTVSEDLELRESRISTAIGFQF